MHFNHGFIVERNERFTKVIDKIFLKAHAEEAPNDESGDTKGGEEDNSSKSSTVINYEDLIAKARKEEKEKQYKTIEKLKTQVSSLTEQHNNDLLNIATLEEKVKASASQGEPEEVKTLREKVESLTNENNTLSQKVSAFESVTPVSREEVEAEVRAELEKEYEVKTYKATKLAEMKDEILVPELVFGNTIEEVDSSLQRALERSNEIKKSLGVSKPRTPKSPSNPSVSGIQDKSISMESLAKMDVSSKEYAELRKQLGLH